MNQLSIDELNQRLKQSNIPSLDGIRAVAVTMVIFYHLDLPGTPRGDHGVMAFFVLSGFLITWLLLKEDSEYGNVSLSAFYKRRILRIFPAFYCFWFISVITLLLEKQTVAWGPFLSSFFYIGNYWFGVTNQGDQVMGITWSLAVEEQFYLLWPLCFLIFRRDLKRLTQVLVSIMIAVSLYRAFLCFYVHPPHNYLEYAFDTRVDDLMAGCLLAVLLKRRVLSRFWIFVTRHSYAPAVTLLLVAGTVFSSRFFNFDYRHVITFAIEPVLIAVLLVQMVALGSTVPWTWLNWPWVRYVGRISYPLYLYHLFALNQTELILNGYRLRYVDPATIALSVALASASYFLVEKRFLALKNKMKPDLRVRKANSGN
jgi:peptidoglycan/LPS O-acetylase OafA/YrhL